MSAAPASDGGSDLDPQGDMSEAPPPRQRRRWLSWLLQALVVALIYFAASSWRSASLLPTDGEQTAPELRLQGLDGQQYSLSELRGKRVQLHFWATWCGVCRQEFGALNAVHAGLDSDEVLLSVVADSEDTAALQSFIREHGINYPVLLGNADAIRAYRVEAFPTNYYLDAAGKIRGTDVGLSTRWGMSQRLGCAR